MRRIFFLARSFPPTKTGGATMRAAQVLELSKHFHVEVYTPWFQPEKSGLDNVHYVRFDIPTSITTRLEKIGILEDYLDEWGRRVLRILMKIVTPDDILFATSGGELECVKIASLLKEKKRCHAFACYHDPLDYATYRGQVVNDKMHVLRDELEEKYIRNHDAIFTTSKSMQKALMDKFPEISARVHNAYLGFSEPARKCDPVERRDLLSIVYGGAFLKVQSPEVLWQAYSILPEPIQKKIDIYYVGGWENYGPVATINHPRIHLVSHLESKLYLRWIAENADVGFVSLGSDYYGLCVPSKIYDYINLELPILGALPKGDAYDIITTNGFGLCSHFQDHRALAENIRAMVEPTLRQNCSRHIGAKKETYSLSYQMEQFVLPILRAS